MLEIAGLVVAVVSAIFAATGHGSILGRLWHALKSRFGHMCRSINFLHGLGHQRLSNDLHHMFNSDIGLRSAVQQHYVGNVYVQNPRIADGYDQYDEYDEY
ncbi:uncharacterized protein LY89DRAFT_781635 [Mollisia scopiformis]|uniref:Uncharacterized protein n=1 Tax=Mollisia scopiformis TaxID=149040 RepID=A0A194XB83_MOLSC|nr:uncharacterized protein LY89DRAFT_781635 [Mollisia scopiformis]KUJ17430.1 hypothetical protein LY89DRAFT_781635 [Mollisia scopiformis]